MNRMTTISIALAIAACSSSHNGNVNEVDASTSSTDATNTGSGDGSVSNAKPTIFTIVLENHDYAEIVGSSDAPYINSLIAQGALATNYKDTIHPSLGNYLHMISGANQYPGYIDLDPTFYPFPVTKENLGTQLEAAHITWRSYQESMGTPCKLTASGTYAPKHDPFLYFTDMQSSAMCVDKNVDYTQFAADLASNTYRYMWITPNLVSDGHDPATDPVMGMRTSDAWMATEVPKILASDGFKANGILFITWDEAEGRNGHDADKIPMIILSSRVKQPGMTSATAFTHATYLATMETLLGLPRLATVTNAPTLMEFLNP
jgi:hypothetical protein